MNPGRGDGPARDDAPRREGGDGTDRSRDAEERLDPDRELLVAALDDELGPEERRDLRRRLDEDPELRREWETMRQVKEATQRVSRREPPAEVWDRYWDGVYRRVERGLGWLLVSIGAILVLVYGAFEAADELLADPSLPGFVKVGVVALAVGLAVLVVSVAREKIFVWKRDPYKDVRR